MDLETSRLLKRGLPLYTMLAASLLVLTLGAILYLGREVFVPVALAVLLSFVLAPAVRGLQRLRLPSSIAVMVTVAAAFGAIALLVGVMSMQLAGLGADLPKYQHTIRDKIGSIAGSAGGGPFARAIEAFEGIGKELQQVGGPRTDRPGGLPAAPSTRPVPVVIQEGGGLLGMVGGFVSPLLHPLATTGLVLIFVVFVLAAREDLRNRFVRLLGTEDIQHTTVVIDDAARRLSRLFLMQLGLNAAFGVAIALGLWLIGIPSPVLWGILAGMLRFIPYIGAVISAVPPFALALAVDPGWSMLLWTALLFLALEPLFGHVLEPLLFGHSTGLAPVAVILAATVWTFLWGPIGLVLATPLTVCLVVLGRHVDRLGFIDVMLGDRPALSPPQIFYQRMLAGDPSEAILQAHEFLRERSLATYYDEVALEALRLAHEDVARGRLTPDRQDVLRRSTETLIADLDALQDPRPKGGQMGAEAAAAVFAAGPDRGASTRILSRDELRPEWSGRVPVVCFAKPDTLDEVIGRMLAQVLTKHGLATEIISSVPEKAEQKLAGFNAGEVRMVCLSYMEPLSTLHLRFAVRLARRAFPGAGTAVCIWRDRDPAMGRALGRAARAEVMAPTIGALLSAIVSEAALKEPASAAGLAAANSRDRRKAAA
ncbi:AI-2E family transporter [uncultured Enterovirga sp.]|uniref:AI-2E family transporter n=1 Tax=uncultured Enterovirga sp. TaxID=2026352 RepID=UPI0035CB201F